MILQETCEHKDTVRIDYKGCFTQGCYGASVELCMRCKLVFSTCACGCSNEEYDREQAFDMIADKLIGKTI